MGDKVLFLAIAESLQRDAGKNEIVIVSPIQTIISEYRIVVVNRKVVTGCQYMKNEWMQLSTECPTEALQLAQLIADHQYQPDPAYVVDVAQTLDGYKVIELNAFSTADWYACDISKIILAIHQFLT